MFGGRKSFVLWAGLIVGATLIAPAGAHVTSEVSHLWTGHIKAKVLNLTYTKAEANERYLAKTGVAADSDKLDGLDSTDFLASTGKASDSDKLDGLDSTDFLASTGEATDSDKLDGLDSTDFALDSDLPAPAEGWHIVGSQGEPGFANINPVNCIWQEYEPGPGEWGPVGFFKDQAGVVHLKGMARMVEVPDNGVCWQDQVIFVLPEGYRPQHTALLSTLAGGAPARVDVKPDGRVVVGSPATEQTAKDWVSLDGLTFRAAPST
jgi:hypothetical protein